MARYTPELIASVRHDYENTDKSLHRIAVDHEISTRGVHRLRDRGGWARRSERARELPPAMRALREATELLAERAPRDARRVAVDLRSTDTRPPPHPSPFQGEGAGSVRGSAICDSPALSGEGQRMTAIARIERLVERELEAEEGVRARLGPLPRQPTDAERCARTLATLTQTLHALARLRSGLLPDSGSTDDDMPRDIDEFRRDFARRIRAFVQSRTGAGAGDGVSAGAALDREP